EDGIRAFHVTGVQTCALPIFNATEYTTLRNEASVAGGGGILFQNPSSYGRGTDWQELIFNNSAKRENHELSVSGGNEKSTFYARSEERRVGKTSESGSSDYE